MSGSSLRRPSITPAQIAGLLVAGVPVIAKVLDAFGVYSLSGSEQAALSDALTWGSVIAGSLFASDAGLRAARNHAHAKVESAKHFDLRSSWSHPGHPGHPEAPSRPSEATDAPLPLAPLPKPPRAPRKPRS